MKNVGYSLRVTAFVLSACWFIYAPVHSLLSRGPFSWHIEQPAARQGFAEVLVLVALFFFALGLRNGRLRIVLGAGVAWIFARRHGVDISIALLYLYVEGILALGSCLVRRTSLARGNAPNAFAAGLVGVVAWSLTIWTCSALGMGSLEAIRLITVVVLGLALAMSREPRFALLLVRSANVEKPLDKLAVALLGAFFLALFAKASVVVDYDSLWYGLQAEEVLVGEGGLFKGQGLVAVVHYYPKLYEALQLPFAGLGSTSLIFGLGIFSWLAAVMTSSAILKELNVSRTFRLWGMVVIATLPALANIAVTAKGDMFSAWALLLAMLGLIRYRNGGQIWLGVAISALVLGVLSRLSNIPYAAILGLLLTYTFLFRWRSSGGISGLRSMGVPIIAGTGVLACLVIARDVLLSGLALVAPDALVKAQLAAGMELKYPVGLLPPGEGLQRLPVLDGLWGILFDPARYPHLLITWTGNVWLFIAVAALVLGGVGAFRASSESRQSWPLLVVGSSFFVVMFGYRFLVPAGDGNYFVVPLACLTMWMIARADGLNQKARGLVSASLILFSFCGAAISFVTGSWGPGTRPIDTVMSRLPFEYANMARQGIAASNLGGVARYLNGMSPGTRVVGFDMANQSAGSPAGWWLPVQYEVAQAFGWQKPEIVTSAEGFKDYLEAAQIEFALIPKSSNEPTVGLMREALSGLAASQSAEVAYRDDHYELWKLKSLQRTSLTLTGGGTIGYSVDKDSFCKQPGNGVVSVNWNSVRGKVAIEVGSPGNHAKLWAEAGGTGSMTTGPWMPQGGEFVFRSGRDGPVLGTLQVQADCP